MLLNVRCLQCDTVEVAIETWLFGSVKGVSDRKTFALHYCETAFSPAPQLLCFSVWKQVTEKKPQPGNCMSQGRLKKGMSS